MLELAIKYIKTVIMNVFHIVKHLSRDMKEFFKVQNQMFQDQCLRSHTHKGINRLDITEEKICIFKYIAIETIPNEVYRENNNNNNRTELQLRAYLYK